MAEFKEVFRQYRRMCAIRTGATCENCALLHVGEGVCCTERMESNLDEAEKIIMSWAAEHPEPQYPTWVQWQSKMFPDHEPVGYEGLIYPCAFTSPHVAHCCENTCANCRKQRIPAYIAEKLGIKPGSEWT